MDVTSYLLGKQAGGGGGSITLQDKSLTITENTTTTVSADVGYDGLGSVEITTNVPSGGGALVEKDVNFYDYDGTLVDSYTKDEFLALSAMPDNPTHEGLTSQEWNYSLADAQSYVSDNGALDIGNVVIPTDGKTKIHIKLPEGLTDPHMGFAVNGTAVIDWGDGSSTDTVTGTSATSLKYTKHQFPSAGEYTISIDVTDGRVYILGQYSNSVLLCKKDAGELSPAYRDAIFEINFGHNITIANYAFTTMRCLEKVSFPLGTSYSGSMSYVWNVSLKAVVLPSDTYFSGYSTLEFTYCNGLKHILVPKNFTWGGSIKSNIKRITLPIASRTSMFSLSNDVQLEDVIIPKGVTVLKSGIFNGCYALQKVKLPSTLTEMLRAAFSSCYSLKEIEIPDSVTSIGSAAFSTCYSLKKVKMPSSATSLPESAFSTCESLTEIEVPSGVTSVGASCFYNCKSLLKIDFSNVTAVPSLLATDAFTGIPAGAKIIVPDNLYDDWIAATNWSNYASYIVKASEY